jgi:hypothetical protein
MSKIGLGAHISFSDIKRLMSITQLRGMWLAC